jgi:hypothetical protein
MEIESIRHALENDDNKLDNDERSVKMSFSYGLGNRAHLTRFESAKSASM